MNELYERYKRLKIDGSYIGLEKGDEIGDYFCTPVGARVIGWDNGIHYCFIDGFGEMVFCVNPDTCCDHYVYPLAKSFSDFLGLLLTTKGTNTLQQIILWGEQEYSDFINSPDEVEWASSREVTKVINTISSALDIIPIAQPFEYVKKLQSVFDYSKIAFNDEFYDITGIEKPN